MIGSGQLVNWTGNEIKRNTHPTRAGLNGLFPSPPKDILPTPIATKLPRTISQTGRLAGKQKASNTPVMRAEPSEMLGFTLRRYFWIRYSKASQDIMAVSVMISAPIPNT